MPKFCDNCGVELKNENVKFCDKCGSKINNNGDATEIAQPSIICHKCGQSVSFDQKNCPHCGNQLKSENVVIIVIGYIISFISPYLGLIPSIYLLIRKDQKSRIQGIIIGIICLGRIIALLLFKHIEPIPFILFFGICVISGLLLWFKK